MIYNGFVERGQWRRPRALKPELFTFDHHHASVRLHHLCSRCPCSQLCILYAIKINAALILIFPFSEWNMFNIPILLVCIAMNTACMVVTRGAQDVQQAARCTYVR